METLASVPTEPPAPRRGRTRRILARIAMAFAGVAVGLVLAELAFRWRDGGAFPHLNVYVADPVLGVRLRPGATEKLAFGGNPITSIRINADGFRGPDLPPPGADEVLVVGDSQVFGLGVEEDQTFAARLGALLHRTVVNAGVPTYGPGEYRAVIAAELAKRHPKTVVLTLTMANDLFEARHPNKDRHAVWDGWAVRKETAPASVTAFPGRAWLFGRSHLFFALRRWWHRHDVLDQNGFASEGTWHDLVATGAGIEQQHRARAEAAKQHEAELAHVEQDLRRSEDQIDDDIRTTLGGQDGFDYQNYARLEEARANPGDIVEEQNVYAEGGRLISVTAEEIRTGAAVRAKLRAELAAWAKAHRGKDAKTTLAQLGARDQLLGKLTELDAERLQAALEPPLAGYLRDVNQLVTRAGARLVVVIVPLDVQVSPAEWAKYGHAPIDMAPSRALTAELVAYCRAMGVSALDGTGPLAAAEPGAFLDKDIHMSAKGHAALAAALAKVLAAPAPPAAVASDRSPVPVPAVWQLAPEAIVTGSTAANCETKRVREWLRVLCTQGNGQMRPTGVTLDRDDTHEAMAMTMPHGVSLVIPLVPGDEVAATVTWPDRTRVLHVRWTGGGQPALGFDAPVVLRRRTDADDDDAYPGPHADFRSPVERAICDCWNRVYGGERYRQGKGRIYIECTGAYGAPDPRCVASYAPAPAPMAPPARWPAADVERCEQMLACVRRDPASPP